MMEICLSYWAMLEASTPIAPDLLTGYAFALELLTKLCWRTATALTLTYLLAMPLPLAYLLGYVRGQHPSQETAPQAAALQ